MEDGTIAPRSNDLDQRPLEARLTAARWKAVLLVCCRVRSVLDDLRRASELSRREHLLRPGRDIALTELPDSSARCETRSARSVAPVFRPR